MFGRFYNVIEDFTILNVECYYYWITTIPAVRTYHSHQYLIKLKHTDMEIILKDCDILISAVA